MPEDKYNIGHMVRMASHMDPIETPLLDAMRKSPSAPQVPTKPDVVKDVPLLDLVHLLSDAVTAEVLRKIKVTGQLPITVKVDGLGQFAVGLNTPVAVIPPLVPILPVLLESPVGTNTTTYTLASRGFLLAGTLATDFWDLTSVNGGEDNDGDPLFPSYDSVKYEGPYVVFPPADITTTTEDTVGDDTQWAGTSNLWLIRRPITVNSLGAIVKIGPEELANIPIPCDQGEVDVDFIGLAYLSTAP